MNFKLLLIILISLALRLIWLDKIPTGLSNDELDYILNAKSLFITGSDISQTWNPLSLKPPTSSFPQAEIPPLLTFIPIGILPLSLFTSKLIYAFFGVATVLTLYLITKKLLGEKAAFFVGLVASFNPWLIYFGRTAYDTPLAILGFLLSLYSLLMFKGWKILLAFPFLFIAFYSYLGTKLIYLPFIFITIFYSWYIVNKKKFVRQYLALLALSLLPFVFFISSVFSTQRAGELSTPFSSSIAETIDYERKLSVQNPLTNVFSNKIVVYTKVSLEKYLNAFSPKFLFINGDDKGLFSVWTHGVFYYTDTLFLLIGLIVLLIKNKRLALLILSLILISPLPSVFSNLGQSYAIRSQMLAPFLIFLVGLGLYTSIYDSKLKFRRHILIGIIVLYVFQFLNFANIYFFRNPIYNSEAFNFSSRILSKYLSLQKGEVHVVNGTPATPLKHYLFYTDSLNNNTTENIKEIFKTKKFEYDNLKFVDCRNLNASSNSLVVFDAGVKCENIFSYKNYLSIPLLGDGGEVLRIVNDTTCSKYKLKRYPQNLTLKDFEIEKLNEKDFCEKFIINYF